VLRARGDSRLLQADWSRPGAWHWCRARNGGLRRTAGKLRRCSWTAGLRGAVRSTLLPQRTLLTVWIHGCATARSTDRSEGKVRSSPGADSGCAELLSKRSLTQHTRRAKQPRSPCRVRGLRA